MTSRENSLRGNRFVEARGFNTDQTERIPAGQRHLELPSLNKIKNKTAAQSARILGNSARSYGSGSRRSRMDALKLNDFEVFLSMIKITVGIGVFNKPYVYEWFGINNGLLSDFYILVLTLISNIHLIDCLKELPLHMCKPDSDLTIGKTVGYILDQRKQRLSNKTEAKSNFWNNTLDVFVYNACFFTIITYIKYF